MNMSCETTLIFSIITTIPMDSHEKPKKVNGGQGSGVRRK